MNNYDYPFPPPESMYWAHSSWSYDEAVSKFEAQSENAKKSGLNPLKSKHPSAVAERERQQSQANAQSQASAASPTGGAQNTQPGSNQATSSSATAQGSASGPQQAATQAGSAQLQTQGVLYVPFVSDDLVEMAFAENLDRFTNKKPLYSVIVKDDNDKANFERLRTQKFNEYKADAEVLPNIIKSNKGSIPLTIQNLGTSKFNTARENCQRFLKYCDVLNKLSVMSNTATPSSSELSKLNPESSKLYILGHGLAGSRGFFADENGTAGALTAEQVAEQLVSGGLSKKFIDFRTLACYSADTTKPKSFSEKDLRKAEKPKYLWTHKLIGKKKIDEQPLAQYLCDALHKHGFQQSIVTGYHGAGATFSDKHHSHHSRRLTKESPPSNDVRASDVRTRFIKKEA